MKKVIVTLGCLVIAPLAFAQPNSMDKKQGATTTEPIEVTGTMIRTMIAEGEAANYQPRNTLVVLQDNANNPARYVLNGRGHVVNKAGEIVQTAIKPGTRVRVYYANIGDLRMIDHVVVVD
jgi:lipopolysaccharide export system protein LptA